MTELQTQDGKFLGADHAVDRLRYTVMSRPAPAALKAKDISRLPSDVQFTIRSHDAWVKAFDKKTEKTSGTYW